MIEITDKSKCCGCSACYSICPRQCIQMQEDEEGFLYPQIKKDACIECGLCEKVCPILNENLVEDTNDTYAIQFKSDKEVLFNSAAGGAFTAIAMNTIGKGGVAFGAAYDSDWSVHHCFAEKCEQLDKFRSSKYVQSSQKDSYKETKELLSKGIEVCYSGTPCQIAGLKKYLGKGYDNLVTVDLVCKGVASPKVFRQYIQLMKEKFRSNIVSMNFKRKTYGYHSSTMSVDFENGKTYSKGGIVDPMMRSFRANICLRPSCSACNFKGSERVSDLTIFDCWHYTELTGKKDNDKGHTAVLVHTQKGKDILLNNGNIEADLIDKNKVIELDGVMVNNIITAHKKRDEFMKLINDVGLMKAIKQTIPISILDYVKEYSKKMLYKLHLIELVKRIFKGCEV